MAMQTDGNMRRMQEEALRRAREMHARATPPPATPPPAPQSNPEPPKTEPALPSTGLAGGIEALVKDKDRTIILALLLILGSEPEKNTTDLLLALLFLLM